MILVAINEHEHRRNHIKLTCWQSWSENTKFVAEKCSWQLVRAARLVGVGI